MFPSQSEIDIIATKILFDAKEAILQLKGWQNSINEGTQRTLFFKETIKAVANQIGGDMKAATAAVKNFASALGINPALITKVGKELQAVALIADQMGISFSEAESRFGGLSIMVAQGAGEMVVFGQSFREALQSGLPLLTATQVALMAISGQISIIKAQTQSFSQQRTNTPLLGAGGAGQGTVPPDYIDAQWEEISGSADNAASSAQKASSAMKDAGSSAEKAGKLGKKSGEDIDSGYKRAVTGVNALRIAMGVLVSMVIFQVIQAFQQLFSMAITGLREMETATYNIVNAERILSQQGIDITPKGLDETIKKLQELDPLLSKIQATELVSRIATNVAPQVGFNAEQIDQFSRSVAILAVQNKGLGYSFEEVEKQMTDAFLTGKVSQGINRLGVKINDQIVKDEALRLGLVKTAEEFDSLTGKMESNIKAQAMLSIIAQKTNADQAHLPEFLKTADAQFTIFQSRLQDFLTVVGKDFGPLLIRIFDVLITGLEVATALLEKAQPVIINTTALISGLIAGKKNQGIFGFDMGQFVQGFQESKDTFKEIGDYKDTLTGDFTITPEVEGEDALKTLADIEEKVQDIILDAKQAQEDLDLKMSQKQDDLELEYKRKAEDAERDHLQKIEDINRDAAEKAADAKADARSKEKQAEKDLLQKLKELRDKYLLDLEEALHKRDARQVLRLMKEYKLDKQNLLDRAKLDKQQRAQDLADKLRDIELERQRKIESENLEYQRKLADLATAKAREQEELQIWYKREQEDIQRNVEQKLQKLLNGYIAEGKLHESQQAKIYGILAKYFGQDMALVDRLAAYMATRLAEVQAMASQPVPSMPITSAPSIVSAVTGVANYGSSSSSPINSTGKGVGMAEGGTIVANRPTAVIFGERGREAATFTPLDRSGADVGRVFGNTQGGGINGEIQVLVELSPDLEARVVQRSMDGVGGIVSRVNRRKQ